MSNTLTGGLRTIRAFHKVSEWGRPLVSIITPSFNSEKTIKRTILSVLDQTYDNIEYIIIDGGSADGTIDIIRKYENRIAYWISEPDRGIGDAFNKGIATSTGELIGIINADDWYCADAVETTVGEYLKHGDCIFHAKLQYWTTNIKPYYAFSGDAEKITYGPTINHPTIFVPKKIYNKVGLFDLEFKHAMDYEWYHRAKLQGVRFHYIDKVTANMRLGGKSDRNWFRSYCEVMKARHIHGMNPLINLFFLIQMSALTIIRKFLEFIRLDIIVRIYRKYFSFIKKDAS